MRLWMDSNKIKKGDIFLVNDKNKKYVSNAIDNKASLIITETNDEFDIERFKNKIASDINTVDYGYELNFLGKNYANLIASQETTTVIEPDIEHNQKEENKNSDNIYISGDNLDAIKHLLNSYSKKIKCIYIDPPYNTNNDDFVYNDSFNFSKDELITKLDIRKSREINVFFIKKIIFTFCMANFYVSKIIAFKRFINR